ncbi:MAG: 4-hydroxy-tetrahydrodipicolinate reductase [Chitinophagales bacterium]|nr:4-hydroxy-tetrahydrodipicolinate reductase [Chitinophagales bacterium]
MKIALIGYGKMGKAIEEEIQRLAETSPKKNAPTVVTIFDEHNAKDLTPKYLQRADVAIEFTTPHTAYNNILKCFEAGIPVVCGTTGWTDKLPELQKICKKQKQALFYASNFSIGVNLFFEVNRKLAKLMNKHPQYEVSLHEIHHTEKKDAPSGTAIVLANDIVKKIKRKEKWVNKKTKVAAQLEVLSYREKDVPGIHIVNYDSEFDSIQIQHSAHSRRGFALGAIQAALWLKGKTGYFDMKDMLEL